MTNNQPTPSAVTDEMVKSSLRVCEDWADSFTTGSSVMNGSDAIKNVCAAYREQNKQLANLQAQVDSAKAYGMRWEEDCISIFDALELEPTTPENVASQKQNALDKCKGFYNRINLLTEERDSLRQQLLACQAAMGKSVKSLSQLNHSDLLVQVQKVIDELKSALTPTTGQSIGKSISDDNEPITREWLTSQGFEPVESDLGSNYPDHYKKDRLNIWEFNDTGRWLLNPYDAIEMKTRGQLRMLVQLMDIELTPIKGQSIGEKE